MMGDWWLEMGKGGWVMEVSCTGRSVGDGWVMGGWLVCVQENGSSDECDVKYREMHEITYEH